MPLRRTVRSDVPRAELEDAAARTLTPLDGVPAAIPAAVPAGGRDDGAEVRGTVPFPIDGAMSVTLVMRTDGTGTRIEATAGPRPVIPYFAWFVGPFLWQARRRALLHGVASIEAEAAGRPPPPTPRPVTLAPPVPFTSEELGSLLTVGALLAVAVFGGSLFTQNIDYIGDTFGSSDRDLGVSLAVARVGVLVTFLVSTRADRVGRRRILIGGTAAVCLANGVAAATQDLTSFTATQVVTRGFVNALVAVSAVIVIEEAPERARAWSIAVLALAGGAGFGLSLLFLPLADLGPEAWRISYVVSALLVFTLPLFRRNLRESTRFTKLEGPRGGRISDVLDKAYRRRFLLFGAVVFAGQVFTAPASQFANRYLSDEHGFTGLDITVFRTVTAGIPGLAGLLVGGRLADSRGRRPVSIGAGVASTAAAMVLFVTGGPVLWLAGTISSMCTAMATPALGAFSSELFPTRFRATSQAMLVVLGVAGSATGLLLAGSLSDSMGGIGPAVAVLGVLPIVVSIWLIPKLPESARRDLDDASSPDPPSLAFDP